MITTPNSHSMTSRFFAGVKFYFGSDGTPVERQRTGTVDNTSVFNEKLPSFVTSVVAGVDD